MAKRTKKRLPQYLSEGQLARLLERPNTDTLIGLRDRVMMETMARAGLRESELVALTPEDISWSTPGEPTWIHVRDGKGGKDRNVPAPEMLDLWLRKWAKRRSGRARTFFHTIASRSGGAITSRAGSPISTRTVRAMVKRYARQAGLPDWVSPHKLRHTFAVWHVREGTATAVVQSMLGHERLATTEIYTRCGDPEAAEAVRRISARYADQQSLDGQPSAAAVAAGRRLEAIAAERGIPVEALLDALAALLPE